MPGIYIDALSDECGKEFFTYLIWPVIISAVLLYRLHKAFLGPFAVVATCMFDVGNSIMCTGGTYALTSGLVHTGENTSL